MKSGARKNYKTMSIAELCALPIADIVADDALLFQWVPTALKPEGLDVMRAWGFEYKTTAYWDKQQFGMGFWLRNEVEELWIGVRGNVIPPRMSERNLLHIPRRGLEHSEKPIAFHHLIERMAARALKRRPRTFVEMFARRRVPGWITTGYSLDGCDVTDVMAKWAR